MTEKECHELYDGKVVINFYPNSHQYRHEGERNCITSVTGATGVIDKSRFLIPWAANLTADFIRDFMSKSKTDEFSKHELATIIDEAAVQHQVKKEKAGSIGDAVHKFAEEFGLAKIGRGKMPEIPKDVDEKVINGINAFLDWFNTNNVKFLAAEKMVYSKKHDYVGQADAIAIIGTKKYLIDYKTGKGIYDEAKFQVTAYRMAYEEETKEKLDGILILHFDKETGGFNKLEVDNDQYKLNIPVFLACLTIKERQKELQKEYYKNR